MAAQILFFVRLRCASIAKTRGYRYFGLQYYGECWSGLHSTTLLNGGKSNQCWGYRPDFRNCDDNSPTECVGTEHYNYIYEVGPLGKLIFSYFVVCLRAGTVWNVVIAEDIVPLILFQKDQTHIVRLVNPF